MVNSYWVNIVSDSFVLVIQEIKMLYQLTDDAISQGHAVESAANSSP